MEVIYRRSSAKYAQNIYLADNDSKREVGRLMNAYSREQMATSDAELRRLKRQWKGNGKAPLAVKDNTGTDPRKRTATEEDQPPKGTPGPKGLRPGAKRLRRA
jgi:hypothetical protein